MELADAVSANQSEIYFAGARYASAATPRRHQRQTSGGGGGVGGSDAFSVGDYFWSSLGRQGRCYLLRLDALFVPMGRRGAGQARQSQAHRSQRMASVSVYYPTDYASDDVNFALQFKRVGGPGGSPGSSSGDCGSGGSGGGGGGFSGFHRLFSPPADHELLRHPKPLTMTLADFYDCVAPGLERHSPDAWSARGLELPDFLASSGQRPRKCGKARVLVLSASAFNRLRRCALGHGLFGWSREDALQCVGDNRLFQCACGTRLFFCRRKHPLYHVNRHWSRQESLAPKHRGQLEQLSIRSEREALTRYQLHLPAPVGGRSAAAQPTGTAAAAAAAKAKERRRRKAVQQKQNQQQLEKKNVSNNKQQKRQKIQQKIFRQSKVVGKSPAEIRRHRSRAQKQRSQKKTKKTKAAVPTLGHCDDSPASSFFCSSTSGKNALTQRQRHRRRLATSAIVSSSVDSVIATVLSSCNGATKMEEKKEEKVLEQDDDDDGKKKAAAFQMRLEAITPPLPQESKPLPQQQQPQPPPLRLHHHQHDQHQLQQQPQLLPDFFNLQARLRGLHHHHQQQQQQQQQQSFVQPWTHAPTSSSNVSWLSSSQPHHHHQHQQVALTTSPYTSSGLSLFTIPSQPSTASSSQQQQQQQQHLVPILIANPLALQHSVGSLLNLTHWNRPVGPH